jgi:hypothetical protein
MTWATVLAPLLRFCQHPRRQRVTTPASTQAAPAGTSDEVPAAPLSHDENLAECRNAAIAVQEQTWNLYEPPPAGGRLDRPRQTIINHAVRPYIVPLLDQQRAHNAAILRSMYAINQMADDHRRETQIDRQETHVHVDQLYLRVYSLEHENRVVNDQLDHINRLMNQRLDDSTRLIHHLSEHNTRLINQRSDDNTRLIHHLFEHNNRVLNHMIELISGLVEQIRGLEDTDTQLLAATRVALAAAGNAAREMETDIREATEE